jgi:DNA-binding transcriptional MocR family regulator
VLLASPWSPRLSGVKGPASERLVSALAADIAEGTVPLGARLPPHRELAYQLGIGLGTVTKAYAVLERRGLVQSVRGRGMFVAGLTRQPAGIVDLSINAPPQMLTDRLLAASLTGLARRLDAGTFGAYAPPAGRLHHRRLMARWLALQGLETEPDRLLLCNGAQHALSIAFAVACRPNGVLLTEALTYPGAIAIARQRGQALVGLAMDEEGILPDALENALRASRSRGLPSGLYVTPTLQNPTTATMGLHRRQEIVRICRAFDITIVEDDVYSIFAGPNMPPLAALAPERTLYVSGLSKTLSPGLRIGSLVVPAALYERALSELQATCTMASPITCLIMEQWLTDGTAASVAASIRSETAGRVVLAKSLLPSHLPATSACGFHVWLPMMASSATAIAGAAASLGVIVLPPVATMVNREALHGGIRLSLGGPTLEELTRALTTIESLVGGGKVGEKSVGP